MGKINHCGKNIPVEARYAVTNYPGNGDDTYFDVAKCNTCGHNVHNFWHRYFRSSKPTETFQSDKHDRGKFNELISSGRAFIIPTHLDEVPQNTKAQVIACEWTLQTIKPADQTARYISLNDKAPWVSNRAILVLEEKRAGWLKQLQKSRKSGKAS